MNHPFAELRPEYEHLLAIMKVTRPVDVEAVARRLVRNLARYAPVAAATHVPAAMIAALHQRESSGNFATYLGNGEPLDHVTKLVPKGRGPWPTWEAGAIDAIHYDHLDDNSAPWSMAYACWKGEIWNGFGPRNHGKHTGYLWGGTNIYDSGKYVRDGVWDPNFKDAQLGIVPVMLRMGSLEPSLQLAGVLAAVPAPSIIPAAGAAPIGVDNPAEIQGALNRLGFGPLVVDGSYGRRTREAVRSFQHAHGLTEDGLAGEKTLAAINESLLSKA